MPRFAGKTINYNSFIRNFQSNTLKRIDPLLRIHYLISAWEEEPAERLEHCALFDPDQGYTEILRILETLYRNPGVISDVSMSRQTQSLPSRK